jgi:hypothetical protein
MTKKKNSLAQFSDVARKQSRGPARKYAEGLTSYERRVKKVKEVAGDCWWLKNYLMDRCGLQKDSKPRKVKNG